MDFTLGFSIFILLVFWGACFWGYWFEKKLKRELEEILDRRRDWDCPKCQTKNRTNNREVFETKQFTCIKCRFVYVDISSECN